MDYTSSSRFVKVLTDAVAQMVLSTFGELVFKILSYVRTGKTISSVEDLSNALGLSRATLYNWLNAYNSSLKNKGGDLKK